jgi:hypothetical protein
MLADIVHFSNLGCISKSSMQDQNSARKLSDIVLIPFNLGWYRCVTTSPKEPCVKAGFAQHRDQGKAMMPHDRNCPMPT